MAEQTMADFESRISTALQDGMVDKDEVKNLFNDLTVEDWRALAANHTQGSELYRNKGGATDLFGMMSFSKFNIQEKDNAFVIQNDQNIVDGKIRMQGLKNFLGTGALATVGFFAARAWQGSTAGLIAAGAIGLGGYIKNRMDTGDLKELAENNYQISISKDGLKSAETAMNTNFKSGVLSSVMADAMKHRMALA